MMMIADDDDDDDDDDNDVSTWKRVAPQGRSVAQTAQMAVLKEPNRSPESGAKPRS